MRTDKFTVKALEALEAAVELARSLSHQQVEPEHLLVALLRQEEGIVPSLLKKIGAAPATVAQQLEDYLRRQPGVTGGDAGHYMSQRLLNLINGAEAEAQNFKDEYISTEHLLLAAIEEKQGQAARLLARHGVSRDAVLKALVEVRGSQRVTDQAPEEKYQALARYTRDLTELARRGKLDPVIGRDDEIRRVMQVLSRRTKNNPVLIGEPGVGKTAIVEGLAQRIVAGDVPPQLADKRILALDISLIVAGTKYRGQFEERLKTIMKELIENRNFIVFIDELHTLVGAGSAEGSLDAANILKPALSRGEIQCIGATTPSEYRRSIEKDRSLERRFQAVKVSPPTESETIRILQGIKHKYEAFHGLRYNDDAVEASVFQSSRYITDRFLPDKAIDVLDEAGAHVKLRGASKPEEVSNIESRIRVIVGKIENAVSAKEYEKAARYREEELLERENLQMIRERWQLSSERAPLEVTREDIEEVISRWTGIPVSSLKEEESQKLLRMEAELHKRIVSQERAIAALARAIRRSRAGLKSPQRPVGSFLFLGPTGVGKTEVARSLAHFLFGSENALIKIDMSEYMEKHSVSRLIGSPPGYVGYEEGGQLTERVKRNPYSVILLDEIEKAHFDIFNILLQVLEDGQLTDSLGNTVDFRNTIVIMTSNIGARLLEKRGALGFHASSAMRERSTEELIMEEVKRVFNPEFLNRLDEIILFNSLTDEDLVKIVELLVARVNEGLEQKKVRISVDDEVKRWIVEKTCHDRSYGARPLRRAIQRFIEDPLAEAMIQGRIKKGQTVEVFMRGENLYYITEGESREDGTRLYP